MSLDAKGREFARDVAKPAGLPFLALCHDGVGVVGERGPFLLDVLLGGHGSDWDAEGEGERNWHVESDLLNN